MELNDVVINAILEKKGMHVCDYDCMELTPFMDHMIVASTKNIRQNNAIAQNIKDRLKEAGMDTSFRIEGNANSKWLLVDLGDTVANLFVDDERQKYDLDRLYVDCPVHVYEL